MIDVKKLTWGICFHSKLLVNGFEVRCRTLTLGLGSSIPSSGVHVGILELGYMC